LTGYFLYSSQTPVQAHIFGTSPSAPIFTILVHTVTGSLMLPIESKRVQRAIFRTLIDMHVPPGGGPPPHRHDFEEMFTVLDGEVQVTFRDETIVARAGQTINVPANAPHAFTNAGQAPVRLLCLCAPAGQEEFFTLVGHPVASRTEPPPPLDAEAQAAFIAKSMTLAPRYKTELLPPPR